MRRRRSRLRGFTVVEMAITAVLMALMATLLGNAWAAFGRPAITTVARSRVAQEANLAAEAIAHDVGRLARPSGIVADSRYQNAEAAGPSLFLAIDDGTGSVKTIRYAPGADDPTKLVRTDLSAPAGPGRAVAGLLSAFDVEAATLAGVGPGNSDVSGVRIDMTFSHRTFDRDPDGNFRPDNTRRFSLFVPDPRP